MLAFSMLPVCESMFLNLSPPKRVSFKCFWSSVPCSLAESAKTISIFSYPPCVLYIITSWSMPVSMSFLCTNMLYPGISL